jgi:hypothetical protein
MTNAKSGNFIRGNEAPGVEMNKFRYIKIYRTGVRIICVDQINLRTGSADPSEIGGRWYLMLELFFWHCCLGLTLLSGSTGYNCTEAGVWAQLVFIRIRNSPKFCIVMWPCEGAAL